MILALLIGGASTVSTPNTVFGEGGFGEDEAGRKNSFEQGEAAQEKPQSKDGECSCEKVPSVTAARELSDAVFSGKVTAIKKINAHDSEVHFQVLQYWKGEGKKTQVLSRTDLFKSGCNYPFEKGVEYLVFVDQTSLDVYRNRFIPSGRAIFNATKCNRTTLLTQAQRELDVLGLGDFPAHD